MIWVFFVLLKGKEKICGVYSISLIFDLGVDYLVYELIFGKFVFFYVFIALKKIV